MNSFKPCFKLIDEVDRIANRVSKMSIKELDEIMNEDDFSKNKLSHRFMQIGESSDLYSLLNLEDPIMLKDELDKKKIWVFAYLTTQHRIEVFPYMNIR